MTNYDDNDDDHHWNEIAESKTTAAVNFPINQNSIEIDHQKKTNKSLIFLKKILSIWWNNGKKDE